MIEGNNHIVVYDGECGLCALSVKFIRRHDKHNAFSYIPQQSVEAARLMGMQDNPVLQHGSVIYIDGGRYYYRSDAAIRILMKLGGVYKLSAIFLVVPKKIRDYAYDLMARNRHRWFKTGESCSI
jgi:predicted DCC family thiol-disulfide oxidoreductase YuxK